MKHAQYQSVMLLGAGCLLLTSLIVWQWQAFKQDGINFSKRLERPVVSKDLFDSLPETQNGLALREDYEDIVNAPLFIEGRKPIAPTDTPVQGDSDNKPFKLTGVVLSPKQLLALLADDKNLSHRLKEGDEIQGWKVTVVQKDHVKLLKNNQIKEITLVENKPNAITAPNPLMPNYPEMPNGFPQELPPGYPMEINPNQAPYAQ